METRPLTDRASTRTRDADEPLPNKQRSAVTNGRKLYVEGDGNSAWSRRYRDLISGHISDLGGRGVLSEAQISLIKRASAIECELEQMEGRLSMSLPIDLDAYTRAVGHLRRTLEVLGIRREARDVTPDSQARLNRILDYASEVSP
jgi:hypothetical protein